MGIQYLIELKTLWEKEKLLVTNNMLPKFCSNMACRPEDIPIAHLSDSPRRRLVVTGDSVRIQVKTTESSTWFFNVLGV